MHNHAVERTPLPRASLALGSPLTADARGRGSRPVAFPVAHAGHPADETTHDAIVVEHEARFIYDGLADRWVRPANVKALWEHWDRPEICWYQGGHLSFPVERTVRRFVDSVLRSRLAPPVAA